MALPALLDKLLSRETLSETEASSLLQQLTGGAYAPGQIAAVLTVFRLRSPTPHELLGFRKAMLELAVPLNLTAYDPIDLCGTGGDGKNTFNISTATAFVVAGAGVPVAKHGNYSASSVSGSSNLLEFLKLPFAETEEQAHAMIQEAGLAFLHAPHWHPAMKTLGPIRKELGFRTIFNLLGPLVNPAKPRLQLVGVSSEDIFDLYQGVFRTLSAEYDTEYCLIHSLDGYDEISLTGTARTMTPQGEETLTAQNFGFESILPESLESDSVASSAEIVLGILRDHDFIHKHLESPRKVVLANAALALRVAKPQKSLIECLELATESLRSGRAEEALKTLKQS